MIKRSISIGAAALLVAVWAAGASGKAPAPVDAPPSFAMCKACHTVTKGGAAGVGPNLSGVVGSAAAAKPGYAYSAAMKASKLRWTRANLDVYLSGPAAKVPGTKMGIPGVKDAAQRKAIIDYLETLK
jgi:cytochrome c